MNSVKEKKEPKPVHMHGRYPRKTGINMNMKERRTREAATLAIGGAAIVILAAVTAKFGVIDQFQRLSAAQGEYESVHRQYTEVETALEDYDRVLSEYRTYSTDWMNSTEDSESENAALYAAVDRQKVLDLVEHDMMSQGTVNSVTVKDNMAVVEMSGMSLDQISRMFQTIGESPIVANVELNMAETEKEHPASILNFSLNIELTGEVAE